MFAIYKRELLSYFTSPVGYVFMGIITAFSAIAFSATTFLSNTHSLSLYTIAMLFVYMVTLPMLTMKLFAEEKKLKTEQLLLTSPVSIPSIVMAKFFAAYTVFFAANIINCLAFSVLIIHSEPELGILFGCAVAFALVGMVFIAVGMLLSSLTENQLAAAIGTFAVMLFFLLLGIGASLTIPSAASGSKFIIPIEAVRFVLNWFSIYSRFVTFSLGIFSLPSALYFVSLTFICLFLICRIYDRRRYKA